MAPELMHMIIHTLETRGLAFSTATVYITLGRLRTHDEMAYKVPRCTEALLAPEKRTILFIKWCFRDGQTLPISLQEWQDCCKDNTGRSRVL